MERGEVVPRHMDAVWLTSYETYKALPPPAQPYSQADLLLLKQVIREAFETAAGEGHASATFRHVLGQYEEVLRRAGLDPDEDTFYYR
eukprot:scaffold21_cov368-Prasinococcus_capsulatus_cf.AAC.23